MQTEQTARTQHTPGEWYIVTEPGTDNYVITHTSPGLNSHVAVLYGGRLCEEHGDLYANARLIAAAPELLAALEFLHERVGEMLIDSDGAEYPGLIAAHRIAFAAIQKARGDA